MSETIVIFRQDRAGECFALFPELPSDESGTSAPPTSTSASTAPPTTTSASPRATPPLPPSTTTSTRNWSGGDTT